MKSYMSVVVSLPLRTCNISTWLLRGIDSWDCCELGFLLEHFIDFQSMDYPLEPRDASEIACKYINEEEK